MGRPTMKYNPAFLSPDELIESFVVRHHELDLILQTVRENVTDSNQHVMVIGPRGIGKTTLVLRVAAEISADETLRQQWYPLRLAEESYQVTSAGEFWLEALHHLAEQTKDPSWRATYAELHKESDDVRLRERALAQLMDFADAEGKRILLIVENMGMLFEQLGDDDGWTIRHTLQNEPRVMLLATATSRFAEIADANRSMYDLFKSHELKPLNTAECTAMWKAVVGDDPQEGSIRPIEILTGGNPRLIRIISSFAGQLSFKELMDDLLKLVDEHTEYFKSHLESLAPTERKVYTTLAGLWDPSTARQVADAARIDTSKASSLLGRLVDRGAVTVVPDGPRKKTYQVAERMYNIYYLLRRRGEATQRVKAMVRFMMDFYAPGELVDVVSRIIEEANGLAPGTRADHFRAIEAILSEVSGSEIQSKLLALLSPDLTEAEDAPESLRRCCDLLQSIGLDRAEFQNRLIEGGETIEGAAQFASLAEQVIEAIKGTETADTLLKLCKETPQADEKKAMRSLVSAIFAEGGKLHEHAIKHYRELLEMLPDWVEGWVWLAETLDQHLGRHDEALGVIHTALERLPDAPELWNTCGLMLNAMDRYEEAEFAYQKAISVQPDFPYALGNLGRLWADQMGRYDEAEAAYRNVIELLPDDSWPRGALGNLLQDHFDRYAEAEQVYREAIDIAESAPWIWFGLGRLFHRHLDRYDEAEQAYSEAFRLGLKDPAATQLFSLMARDQGQPDKALRFLREHMETVSENANLLNDLAWVAYLSDHACLIVRAEDLVKRAISLAPDRIACQHTLACVLSVLGRDDEAVEAAAAYMNGVHVDDGSHDVRESVRILMAELAAAGHCSEALEMLVDSPMAKEFEPLILGLHVFSGETVTEPVAAEIVEISSDIVKRIEERRERIDAIRAELAKGS